MVSGLEESVQLEWNGDVDFGTGELQQMYRAYQDRLKRVDLIINSVFVQAKKCIVVQSLKEEQDEMKEDLTFIANGMSMDKAISIGFVSR